ncbi:hypothetical protein GQ457_15G012530 [Hibiscus cannabinus]
MFNMLNSIGQFGGSPYEDASQHLRSFIEDCNSFRQLGVHEDVLQLKLFSYSLRDRARLWFNSIPSGSVESWDDLCRNFIMRMMLDASANGTLLNKSAENAPKILDRLANNDYQFPSSMKGMARRNGAAYELELTDSISAQLVTLTNMVKNLQRPSNSQEVKLPIEENGSPENATAMEEPSTYATVGPNVAASTPKTTKSNEILRKQKYEYQFKIFLDILKQVHINLPLVEAIEKMTNYVKFLKDIVSKQTRLSEFETIAITKGCTSTLNNRLPPKLKDPGSFTIPCTINNHHVGKALCDLGANINLTPKSVFQRLGMLQLADRSYIQLEGKIEYILVRVDKFIFSADFIVLDCETDEFAPIILGRPFLALRRTLIDVEKGQLPIRVNEQQVTLNVFKALKCIDNPEECHNVDVIDAELETYWRNHYLTTESESENLKEQKLNEVTQQEANRVLSQLGKSFKFLDHSSKEIKSPKTSIKQHPTLKTNPMLRQLKYDHLGKDNTLPITLSFELQYEQENRLNDTLVRQKEGASLEIHDEKIAMTSSKKLL